MKRYIITWFNYIAQKEVTIKLLASSDEEAEELAVKFMDAQHPQHKHSNDDISTITCLDYEDRGFLTKYQIDDFYNKSMKVLKNHKEEIK